MTTKRDLPHYDEIRNTFKAPWDANDPLRDPELKPVVPAWPPLRDKAWTPSRDIFALRDVARARGGASFRGETAAPRRYHPDI